MRPGAAPRASFARRGAGFEAGADFGEDFFGGDACAGLIEATQVFVPAQIVEFGFEGEVVGDLFADVFLRRQAAGFSGGANFVRERGGDGDCPSANCRRMLAKSPSKPRHDTSNVDPWP